MTTTTTRPALLSPVDLVAALAPLLDDARTHRTRIVDLLRAHDDLAEHEVARSFARRRLPHGFIAELLASAAPRVRREGVELVRIVCAADEAARFLRPRAKDSDPQVRMSARQAIRELLLDDTALPDRATPERWDPSAWASGDVVHATRPTNLARWSLPVLADVDALCALVGVTADELPRLMRPGAAAGAPYVSFTLEKASGGARTIMAPRARLREVQRRILRDILDKVPAHGAAHGFIVGRSVKTNAAVHSRAKGAAVILKLDLKDFFPTIHFRRVAGLFRALGYDDVVARTLAGLTTCRYVVDDVVCWPGQLPQGAPTSPAIANLVCRHLDARLAGLAAKVGAAYSRYADDLTFSFSSTADISRVALGRFAWWVDQICGQEGFVENTKKRRVLRSHNRQLVTGVVVNGGGLRVPRDDRRRFKAILANCAKNGVAAEAAKSGHDAAEFPAYLRGFASWVFMLQPKVGQRFIDDVERLLGDRSAR